MPPGLKGIIGAASQFKMALTTKGDPYVTLTFIVKDPEELNGRRATVSWFINDSQWRTAADELENLANDLILLGAEMPEQLEDLPDVLKDLCERGIHAELNTGRERKNGGAPNVFIQGLADGWEDEQQEGWGEQEAQTQTGGNRGGGGGSRAAANGSQDSPKDDAGGDGGDGGDVGEGEGAEAPQEEAVEWDIQVGDEYAYTPPKGKKVNVVVEKVDKRKKTVDLKSKTKPPKTFKGVKWDALEGAD